MDTAWKLEIGELELGQSFPYRAIKELSSQIATSKNSQYSISISGGGLSGTTKIGSYHRSTLGNGSLDWWPELIRNFLWIPLGLTAELQWIILGISVGLVMGGSQALARSLFAQITPETRSGEFFSFFGFMSRASSVFGPMLYVVVTAMFDTRMAVASILSIIIAGTAILKWVNVEQGVTIAREEDKNQRNTS
jgi:MFS-type transporter involved in bile tolerance (Atg22 family)